MNEKHVLQRKRNTVLTGNFDSLIENTGTVSDKIILVITYASGLESLLLFVPFALNNTILLVNCGRIKRGKHVLKPAL